MLTISRNQIDAIRSDPLLGPAVASGLSDPRLLLKPAAFLSPEDWDDLNDACIDALMNDAPVVETFDAEQSKGVYTVSIFGVPGAYYVTAPEFDYSGVFSTVENARDEAEADHGEFRVSAQEYEEQEEATPMEPTFSENLLAVLTGTDNPRDRDKLRNRISGDADLVMLANGCDATNVVLPSDSIRELVSSFEKTLPKPQGAIEGMARGKSWLPRLCLRAELFLRLNGRLPDPQETAALYDIS